MGRRVPSLLLAHDGHFLAIARIAADRRDDLSRARFEAAPNDRQIFSLKRAGAAMVGEEIRQALMGRVGLGYDQSPGGALVQPVHDSWPLDSADARQARAAMADQRIDQRASRVA